MSLVKDQIDLGLLIHAERKHQKLTQEQLAALAGVGVRFVRELEKGKDSSHIGLAFAVMLTLGMTVDVKTRGGSV